MIMIIIFHMMSLFHWEEALAQATGHNFVHNSKRFPSITTISINIILTRIWVSLDIEYVHYAPSLCSSGLFSFS